MGADCMMLFGYCSLHKTIPEARGKIRKIHLEGVIVPETELFKQDLLELLADGGMVCQEGGPPVIFKKGGKLYVNRYRWVYDWCEELVPVITETVPYIPWTTEVTKQEIVVRNLGVDALGWFGQIQRVRRDTAKGIWDYMKQYKKTPFDPTFDVLPSVPGSD